MVNEMGLLSRLSAAAALAFALLSPTAASALSTKECSTKYQAAKDAGTLGGKNWNAFRKEQCGSDAAPAAAAASEAKAPPAKAAEKPAAAPKATSGAAVFPGAISAKFSSETPTKQRFHTCLEQYRANKTTGGNGGLRWVQKGGGYYSQCNAKLKG